MADQPFPGFAISGDIAGRTPLVLASPHSGREYPEAFVAASRLTLAQLRRAEDPFVDALLDGVRDAPVIKARFGRAWLDLNRAEDELDPLMFEDSACPLPPRRTDRVAAGLGVLPRVAAQGLDIYRRRIGPAEGWARIAGVHRPYHTRLAALLEQARLRHGYAILLDCHSMPPPALDPQPQLVVGDRWGASAAPSLTGFLENFFAAGGWRVARNSPYAGAYTAEAHGRPAAGVHVVQIEIDRALYMDPVRLVRHSGFGDVARRFTALVAALIEAAPRLALAPPLREAAE